MADENGGKARSGSVQSIERAFGLLEMMADAGGMMGLSQLARPPGCRCRRSTGWSARSWTSATCARSRRGSTCSARS